MRSHPSAPVRRREGRSALKSTSSSLKDDPTKQPPKRNCTYFLRRFCELLCLTILTICTLILSYVIWKALLFYVHFPNTAYQASKKASLPSFLQTPASYIAQTSNNYVLNPNPNRMPLRKHEIPKSIINWKVIQIGIESSKELCNEQSIPSLPQKKEFCHIHKEWKRFSSKSLKAEYEYYTLENVESTLEKSPSSKLLLDIFRLPGYSSIQKLDIARYLLFYDYMATKIY